MIKRSITEQGDNILKSSLNLSDKASLNLQSQMTEAKANLQVINNKKSIRKGSSQSEAPTPILGKYMELSKQRYYEYNKDK